MLEQQAPKPRRVLQISDNRLGRLGRLRFLRRSLREACEEPGHDKVAQTSEMRVRVQHVLEKLRTMVTHNRFDAVDLRRKCVVLCLSSGRLPPPRSLKRL